MKKTKIYLLTGPVRSGKTTALQRWIQGRNDVHGILSPDQGKGRSFHNIQSGERWNMEATKEDPSDLSIGRFRFSKAAFDKANEVLIKSWEVNPKWMIVDEVGPLELNNSGLRTSLDHMVRFVQSNKAIKCSILWVVRDSIIERVKKEWELECIVINKEGLVQLS